MTTVTAIGAGSEYSPRVTSPRASPRGRFLSMCVRGRGNPAPLFVTSVTEPESRPKSRPELGSEGLDLDPN